MLYRRLVIHTVTGDVERGDLRQHLIRGRVLPVFRDPSGFLHSIRASIRLLANLA